MLFLTIITLGAILSIGISSATSEPFEANSKIAGRRMDQTAPVISSRQRLKSVTITKRISIEIPESYVNRLLLGDGSKPLLEAIRQYIPPPLNGASQVEANAVTHRNRNLLPKTCGAQVKPSIIGGIETDLDDFPWMALVRVLDSFRCAGTLITQRYVLTAAHCVRIHGIPEEAVDLVRLGEHDLLQRNDCQGLKCNRPPQDVSIEERIVHPGFNISVKNSPHDIALLRLDEPVVLSQYVQPICLPLDGLAEKTYEGSYMWTAGWGLTEHGWKSDKKQKVKLPIVPLETCAKKYGMIPLVGSQMCAGGELRGDTCSGDSGAPLMNQDLVGKAVRWILQGIVSFGPHPCGKAGIPGIYTRVANYVEWILDNIRV